MCDTKQKMGHEMSKRVKWSFTLAALCATSAAHAQERFGKQGQFAVSAERLFGVVHSTQTATQADGTEDTENFTQVSLLSTQFGSFATIYTTPRVGLDYFIIDGLTLGAAFGVFSVSSTVSRAGNPDVDGPTVNGVIVAPRIGYAYMFTDVVGIWPRGGITYWAFGTKDNTGPPDETSVHLLALTLEAPLVISPVPHAGFLVSPIFDIGLSGSTERKDGQTGVTTSRDFKATEYGLEAGMFLYF